MSGHKKRPSKREKEMEEVKGVAVIPYCDSLQVEGDVKDFSLVRPWRTAANLS